MLFTEDWTTLMPEGMLSAEAVLPIAITSGFRKDCIACSDVSRDNGTRRTVSRTTAMALENLAGHFGTGDSDFQCSGSSRRPCQRSAANSTTVLASSRLSLLLRCATSFAASPTREAAWATCSSRPFSTDSSYCRSSSQNAASKDAASSDMLFAISTISSSSSFSKYILQFSQQSETSAKKASGSTRSSASSYCPSSSRLLIV
mmetsp:Transcript_105307/g.187173  ORF Transcript_105307/g.187173 Transcript_105307/m.187173 type:complete len:203 (+) Transcript_105307:792-1400(+)